MKRKSLYSKQKRKGWNKGLRKQFSKGRRTQKHFIYFLPVSFGPSYNRNVNTAIQILKQLTLFLLLFFKCYFFWFLRVHFFVFAFCMKNWTIYCVTFSLRRSRHWQVFCKTAVRQDISKTIAVFLIELIFSTVYYIRKLTNVLKRKSLTDIFLGLWSKSSICNFTERLLFLHSCEWLLWIINLISAIKKLGRWKSNNSIKFPRKNISNWACEIVTLFLKMKHSFKMWLNNDSWCEIFDSFSKTADSLEKKRQHF